MFVFTLDLTFNTQYFRLLLESKCTFTFIFTSSWTFCYLSFNVWDVFTWTGCSASSSSSSSEGISMLVLPFSPSRDVFSCQRNVLSFIFICCGYRAAGRYWWVLFVLCPHFWGTSRVVSTMNSITQRETRPVWWQANHCGDAQVMGPNYTLHTLFSHSKRFIFFLCRLRCVNVSTCVRFPGHSQALKVNTSFTSSRMLSSIIKAVSRAICITLSIQGRPGSGVAGHAERTTLRKFGDCSDSTGCIRHWWAATNCCVTIIFIMY